MFQTYLVAIDIEKWPNTRIRAVLLHCLSNEGQWIFYALLNSGTKYEEAVEAMRAHFILEINVVVERHKFRQRKQKPNVTEAEYVGTLHELTTTSEFAENTDAMICDQLIEYASCAKVCESLLEETDARLTLDKAIMLACHVEAATGHTS